MGTETGNRTGLVKKSRRPPCLVGRETTANGVAHLHTARSVHQVGKKRQAGSSKKGRWASEGRFGVCETAGQEISQHKATPHGVPPCPRRSTAVTPSLPP